MFTKFNTIRNTIFLDPNSDKEYNIPKNEKVNIILSPSLYWVKKVSLPVKYARDAKRLIPSLFEETLPLGTYRYYVYKSGDEFYIFAYEDKVLLDALSKANISHVNIVNLHFAQSEMKNLKGVVHVNDEQNLYVKEGLVILVPSSWSKENEELNLYNLTLSKHKVALQQYAHIVESSTIYKMIAILSVIIILIFGEYLITIQKTKEIVMFKDEVFSKYDLKPTILQNKSMLIEYESIHEKQTKLREYIAYMLAFKLQDKERLSKLILKNNTLTAEFINISEKTHIQIKDYFTANQMKFTLDIKDGILKVGIDL
ncbi:MAG: hypothetical protein JJV95_07505 [Sulfurospirillum sp.]|nr:hypothetical protein [Sulfurospirillum sp.]MBL0703806.1 hypothetical protein [Sulfurospirillum sp.]